MVEGNSIGCKTSIKRTICRKQVCVLNDTKQSKSDYINRYTDYKYGTSIFCYRIYFEKQEFGRNMRCIIRS